MDFEKIKEFFMPSWPKVLITIILGILLMFTPVPYGIQCEQTTMVNPNGIGTPPICGIGTITMFGSYASTYSLPVIGTVNSVFITSYHTLERMSLIEWPLMILFILGVYFVPSYLLVCLGTFIVKKVRGE